MRGSGSYLYPFRAQRGPEQAELADWPPMRPSGPEPGSADMPPIPGPLGNYYAVGADAAPQPNSNGLPFSSGTILLAGIAVLAYLKWGRKK